MPSRLYAIATCSCGAKWGDSHRAARDEMSEALERVVLANAVPTMVRHWRLGHRLTGHDKNRWMHVIAHAANEIAIKNPEPTRRHAWNP